MIKYSIIVLLFISNYDLHGQQFDIYTAINYAMEHNYDYKKQQLDRAITYEKTQEVLSSGFPKINGSIGYQNTFILNTSLLPGEIVGKPGELVPVQFGTKNNATAGVSVSQLIFDGRYLVGVQARTALKDLANSQLKISERDVKALIIKSYYQVLASKISLKSLKESKEVLDLLLSQTKIAYKEGVIEELDVERLELNTKSIANAIQVLESQSEMAENALKYNMGYPLESNLYLKNDIQEKIDSTINDNFVINSHFENREEFTLMNENLALKKYDIKQLKASFLPSVYSSFNYGYQAFRPEFNFFGGGEWFQYGNFGIQMSVPIFQGMTRKYQINQAKLNLSKTQIEQEQLYNGLKLQSINSILSLNNSITDYKTQVELLNLAKKMESKTQIKYKEGVGSSFEFSTAQTSRVNQNLNTIKSMLSLIESYVNYQVSSGQLN